MQYAHPTPEGADLPLDAREAANLDDGELPGYHLG